MTCKLRSAASLKPQGRADSQHNQRGPCPRGTDQEAHGGVQAGVHGEASGTMTATPGAGSALCRPRRPLRGRPVPSRRAALGPLLPGSEDQAQVGSRPSEPKDSVWRPTFLPNGLAAQIGLPGLYCPLRGVLLDGVHLFFFILYLLFTAGNIPVFFLKICSYSWH